jgi:hypothetical protein
MVGEAECIEKRPIARPRHRCVNSIMMDHGEVEWGGMSSGLVWLRVVHVILES